MLPEDNISDIKGSNKHSGIPQANGNYEEATKKAAVTSRE